VIPTYPARPVNGGKLELAPIKRGIWLSGPKWNGWRAEVNTQTGHMWNRHGDPLSISNCFSIALKTMKGCGVEWLDCEALDRRHAIGRGSLIVLDVIIRGVPYEERKAMAAEHFPVAPMNPSLIESNKVYVSPYVADGEMLYEDLRPYSGFFEGIVMKKSQSMYPFQLRTSSKETPDWVKHRYDG
jgi:hypothetical protein